MLSDIGKWFTNMNNSTNFNSLYFILGAMAIILILTGFFLDDAFEWLNLSVDKKYLLIAQIAFVLSGIADLCLLFYAKKKLS